MKEVGGLVLAGGSSRRMRRPKAGIDYHGQPQVRYLVGLLWRLLPCVRVAVPASLANEPQFAGLPLLLDSPEARGPMAAILAAHRSGFARVWLAVAVDMPNAVEHALGFLLSHRDPRSDVTAYAASDGRLEPLFAIYEPSSAAPISLAAAAGCYSLRDALRRAAVTLVLPPDAATTLGVDTPRELECVRGGTHA